jgi:hypothetical protein
VVEPADVAAAAAEREAAGAADFLELLPPCPSATIPTTITATNTTMEAAAP